MFREGKIDTLLRSIKRLIPEPLFALGARIYHPLLAWTGALRYGFPSRKMKVIGVTGTKGKSTTVYLIARALEASGYPVAAVGSLGYKIKNREWPNLLKMTMPGRWRMQRFLREAANAGCTHCVIECPSEGLAQGRHLGIRFDGAVFLNLHPEHLEAHGSFEAYRAAKQILFNVCRGLHVVNGDDPNAEYFTSQPARKHLSFGMAGGDVQATDVQAGPQGVSFSVGRVRVDLRLGGIFNAYNALAALTVADAYGVPVAQAKDVLETIREVPGRMQWVQREPFGVVVDYAHTPDSLHQVYRTLKPESGRLICVLGSAGGGRDKWKRPKFGALAERFCDRIYLTDEDPYDEDPERIIADVASGISDAAQGKVERILDRRTAIIQAIGEAHAGDVVVITGKGSETSMALARGRKIDWSDAQVAQDALPQR